MSWQLRRYLSSGERVPMPSDLVGAFSYTIEAMGGNADFSLTMQSDDVDNIALQIGDRIEMWDDRYVGVQSSLGRKYRGYVTEINPSQNEPTQIEIVGYGRMFDLTLVTIDVRYQYQTDVDVSIIFGDIAAEVQKRYPDIVLEVAHVGVNIDSYDARGKNAEEAIQGLLGFAEATVRYGFDVDDNGKDRLYLRVLPTISSSLASVVVGLQEPTVTGRSLRKSVSELFTVAVVEGSTPKYAQLLPNGSFEVLRRVGDSGGNLLSNPGFEDVLNGWTVYGGASLKGADPGLTPRTGDAAIELDTVGEGVKQTDQTPVIALKENTDYLLTFYAAPQTKADLNNPPVIRGKVIWTDSFGADIIEDSDFFTCDEGYYRKYELLSRSPPFSTGLTGFRIEVEQTGGSFGDDRGVYIDDFCLADASILYAVGWDAKANGAASIQSINWGAGNAYHGANCLSIYVTSSDVDNEDIIIAPSPIYYIDCVPGQDFRLSMRYRGFYLNETPPKLEMQIRWRKEDGSQVGATFRSPVTPVGPVPVWTYAEGFATAPNDAVKAEVKFAIRGNGGVSLDALSMRVYDEVTQEYIQEGSLRLRFRIDELITEAENYDAFHAIEWHGLRDVVINSEATTVADARAIAKSYLLDASRFIPEPSIQFIDDHRTWWTDMIVRFNGEDAEYYQDGPMPVIRINGSIDGDARIEDIQCMRIRPTIEDILRRLPKNSGRSADSGIGNNGAGTAAPGSTGGSPGTSVVIASATSHGIIKSDITETDPVAVTLTTYNVNKVNTDASAAEVVAARSRPLTSPFAATVYANLAAHLAGVWTAMANIYNRTITAGTGLVGGGDLNANRSIALADTAVVPGSYTAPTLTVDQQGRITSAANGTSGTGTPTMFAGKYSISRPASTGKNVLATHQFFHIYFSGPTGAATAVLHAANDANRVMPVTIRNDDTIDWNIDVLGGSGDVIYTGPGTASVTSYLLVAGYSVTLFVDNTSSVWAWYILD